MVEDCSLCIPAHPQEPRDTTWGEAFLIPSTGRKQTIGRFQAATIQAVPLHLHAPEQSATFAEGKRASCSTAGIVAQYESQQSHNDQVNQGKAPSKLRLDFLFPWLHTILAPRHVIKLSSNLHPVLLNLGQAICGSTLVWNAPASVHQWGSSSAFKRFQCSKRGAQSRVSHTQDADRYVFMLYFVLQAYQVLQDYKVYTFVPHTPR